MKMKTILTREESQHLIDLGVSKEKASINGSYYSNKNHTIELYTIFKLEDFLNGEILPKWIKNEAWGFIDEITMRYDEKTNCWWAGYVAGEFFSAPELIDALYELACWYYGEYLKSEKNDNR